VQHAAAVHAVDDVGELQREVEELGERQPAAAQADVEAVAADVGQHEPQLAGLLLERARLDDAGQLEPAQQLVLPPQPGALGRLAAPGRQPLEDHGAAVFAVEGTIEGEDRAVVQVLDEDVATHGRASLSRSRAPISDILPRPCPAHLPPSVLST
jgi:hypothetical protein